MKLDHIAISGESLLAASSYVEQSLGITLQSGGKHAKFGTHNKLLGLAGGIYLEVIAIDPRAPKPNLPRWFNLDNFSGSPRITNWICRTKNINQTLSKIHLEIGKPLNLSRDSLNWKITVPDDGKLPYDGAFPSIIQWNNEMHPSNMLIDAKCSLKRLTISHPDASGLRGLLNNFIDPRIQIEQGRAIGFFAEFNTPNGTRTLR